MAHVPRRWTSDRGGRVAASLAVVIAVTTVAGIVLLRPTAENRPDTSSLGQAPEIVRGKIVAIEETTCGTVSGQGSPIGATGLAPSGVSGPAGTSLGGPAGLTGVSTSSCVAFTFTIASGPDAGERFTQQLPADSPRTSSYQVGDPVVLGRYPDAPSQIRYGVLDPDRRSVLMWLTLIFAVAVVVLGGIRGLAALVGLGVSVVVLLAFVVPAIIDGRDPLAVSLVAASAIAFAALYLAHGFTRQTTVALLGTLSGLLCVAILAIVFMALARITGVGSEDALIVSALTTNIDLGGIVLGGIVIGALGAIDDMTVTQASAIAELRAADPTATHTGLLRSGMRIGRDHVASTVNTLFLAYAGASLPLLILFVLSQQSVGTVVNREVLATEVVRTLVGSFGLVVSVPVTTWLAVRLVDTPPRGRPRGRAASAERPPEAEASDAETLGPPDELHLPERRRDAFW